MECYPIPFPVAGARLCEPQQRLFFKAGPYYQKGFLLGGIAAGHRPALRLQFDNSNRRGQAVPDPDKRYST